VIDRVRASLRETFRSLRSRNFLLFFVGQSISNSGNWLTNVALTLLVLKRTGSGVAVGALAACQYGPILLLSAWGGAIADRSDKRRLLFVTQGLEMAQSVGLAVMAFLPGTPLGGLFALAVCGGVLLAFDNPLRRSFVTEMVPAEDIPNAVVLYSTILNLSRVFGPALAGLLVSTVGYGWCFALDAVSYLAVLVCLALMRTSELRRRPPRPRVKGEVREGLRYLASVPVLWITFVMFAVVGLLAYNFNVSLPLFVTRALHGSERMFTVLYSVLSTGSLAGALLVARRTHITLRQIVRGALGFGVAMLLFAAMPGVGLAVPTVFLVGVASVVYLTASTAIVQMEARHDMHGRVLALQTVLMGGSSALGGPLLGALADVAGARSLMIVGGVACLVSAAFGHLAGRRYMAR